MPGLGAFAPGGALLSTCRIYFFGISRQEVSFERRRFAAPRPDVRDTLERAGGAFVDGYNAALQCRSFDALLLQLRNVPADLAGFAHEGSAMALALLDLLIPFQRSRWQRFVDAADDHVYLIHVGAGWALARARRRRVPAYLRGELLLTPLLYDGFGFHEGFFHAERTIQRRWRPSLRDAGAMRAFDQGLGRSLWFVECADAARIGGTVGSFERERQADLWSGVGLAAAYAGGVSRQELEALTEASREFREHVAQGVAFAARARQRAGNLHAAAMLATDVLCGIDAAAAAGIAEEAAQGLRGDGSYETYEQWRGRIRDAFRREWRGSRN